RFERLKSLMPPLTSGIVVLQFEEFEVHPSSPVNQSPGEVGFSDVVSVTLSCRSRGGIREPELAPRVMGRCPRVRRCRLACAATRSHEGPRRLRCSDRRLKRAKLAIAKAVAHYR